MADVEHDDHCPDKGDRRCECDYEARVRADEREQVGRVWAKREDLLLGDIEVARADERAALNGKLLTLYLQLGDMLNDYNHAEAVAARLVEVICEQESLIVWNIRWREQAEAERDAARAEVDRLNIEIGKVVDSRERTRVEMGQKVIDAHREVALARAEVAALREQIDALLRDESTWGVNVRREVLADLRAKVEVLGLCIEPDDGEPECFCNDVALYAASRTLDRVLALIEEADRG